MKKAFLVLIISGLSAPIFSQAVLSGYDGFWYEHPAITILDLADFSSEELGYLRNEVFAMYGRPFKTEKYREHFKTLHWYREIPGFQDSWLSDTDRANVHLILSVEKTKMSRGDVIYQVLTNIEYKSSDEKAIITFRDKNKVIWSDRNVNEKGMDGRYGGFVKEEYSPRYYHSGSTKQWAAIGPWVIIYSKRSEYIVAYMLDHSKSLIADRMVIQVGNAALEKFINGHSDQ